MGSKISSREFSLQETLKEEPRNILTQMVQANRISLIQSETFWRFQGWGLLVLIVLGFFPTQFHHQEYTFFALLILAVGVSWIEGQSIWVRTEIDWPILLLILWILITIPFAVDQAHSWTEWRKLAGRFLVFYWALLVFQRHRQDEYFTHVSMAVMVGAASLSGFAIWDFFDRGGTIVHRGVRATAPSSHSHWLAAYIVISWPLVFFLFTAAKSVWKKLLLIGVLVILSVAEFLAFSRGAWVAIACQIFLMALVTGGLRLKLGSVLGVALCVLGLWWISQKGYLVSIFSMQSVADRIGCWKLGMEEIIAHPILGVGFGNNTFAKIYPGDPPGDCGSSMTLPTGSHLHNTWLMFAMGSGIPAFIFLLWMLVKGLKVLMGGMNNPIMGDRVGFRLAVALMAVGFWIGASFDYLFTGSLAYLFMILLASGIPLCWQVDPLGPKGKRTLEMNRF